MPIPPSRPALSSMDSAGPCRPRPGPGTSRAPRGLGQPTLAPAVVLDVPVAGAPRPAAQVKLLDIGIGLEHLRGAVHADAAVLHQIPVAGHLQGDASVLLHQQDADLLDRKST